METFHWLDWTVIGLFMVSLVGTIVWAVRKREANASDYFLSGREAGWVRIGASIFSSNIGSEHLVGLAGAGFATGMAMAHWEMQGWMILILGWVFVPLYDRIKVFTMPEFLERRFSAGSRSVLSIISMVSYVMTKIAVTVYAGGVVFKTVFGIESLNILGHNVDFFWISAIGLVVITGIYTIAGGMRVIMYTAVLQTPVLLLGSIFILSIGLHRLGGWHNFETIIRAAHPTNLHLWKSMNDPNFPWLGVLGGSAIIGFWYWCTDQYIVQRVLAGRNQQQSRRGSIFAGYLKLLPVFIFLVPGMIAFALSSKGLLNMPAGPHAGDAAFSSLVAQLLPVGVKGLVVCGLLTALMASLSSKFNASATLFTVDFYQKWHPTASGKQQVLVGRLATTVIVLLGILWIPVMKSLGNVLYEYLQNVQGLLAPAISSVFIMGVFWKRTSDKASFWTMAIGFSIAMIRLISDAVIGSQIKAIHAASTDPATVQMQLQVLAAKYGFFYHLAAINWLFFCEYLFLLCIVLLVVISLISKAPSDTQLQYSYSGATPEERKATKESWNWKDVVLSLGVVAIVVCFYIKFW